MDSQAPASRPAPDGERAGRWARVVVALRTSQLRAAYLRQELRQLPVGAAAAALEVLCVAADGGAPPALAALHALVELLASPELAEAREALRRESRERRHFHLERMLRRPFVTGPVRPSEPPRSIAFDPDDPDVQTREERRDLPDYGRGRPLTLGERKSIARRPPPELLPRVLADPHPDVIRMVLAAARLTEDDVVRLCSRRPNRGEVLAEVARHPRWCNRPRVRAALVLNPTTPTELAITLVALLRRAELVVVCESTQLHPAVRAAARERLDRKPPVRRPPDGEMQ
ncbi:MAG: hypothetical protein NVS3B10_17090 [Polyangiales bacterium]